MSTPIGSLSSSGYNNAFEPRATATATPTTGKGEMPLVPLTGSAASGPIVSTQQGTTPATSATQLPAPRTLTGAAAAATSGTPSASTPASNGSTQPNQSLSNAAGTDTFLQLLVAQMKNQDPSSPMDDSTFVTELAQFNTVEQMLSLNQTITAENSSQQAVEGISMIGKSVTYALSSVTGGQPTSSQGTVSGVSMNQGQVELQIGSDQVPISEVTAVS